MKRSNVVAAVSILCVSSVSAPALADSWNIHQSNTFDVTFKIDKAGDRLTGTAFYVLGGSRIVNGVVEGKSFNGADLDFTVRWDNGTAGHYTGTIGSDGFVRNGRTADVNNGPKKDWWSTTAVRLGSAGAGAVKPTLSVQAVPNQLQNGFHVRLGGSGFRAGEAVLVNYRSVTQGTATPWSFFTQASATGSGQIATENSVFCAGTGVEFVATGSVSGGTPGAGFSCSGVSTKSINPGGAPIKSLGRVTKARVKDGSRSICDAARDARARSSPAAPNLEAQCLKGGGG